MAYRQPWITHPKRKEIKRIKRMIVLQNAQKFWAEREFRPFSLLFYYQKRRIKFPFRSLIRTFYP